MDDIERDKSRLLLRDNTYSETWEQIFPTVVDGRTCPLRWMLHRIGERWSLMVLCYLNDNGAARFSEIAAGLGEQISNRMLALTLDKLETNGLVARSENAAAAIYALTDLGRSLMTPMRMLIDWIAANVGLLDEGRRQFGLPPLDMPQALLDSIAVGPKSGS